jgi:hypothetical protein
MKKCRCGVDIIFIRLSSGRLMPCLAKEDTVITASGEMVKGYQPHFIDCPYSKQFRKERSNAQKPKDG